MSDEHISNFCVQQFVVQILYNLEIKQPLVMNR